ncbi:squamous cell carcinoma antigen recognized by T-cells 3 [Fagus crenata]
MGELDTIHNGDQSMAEDMPQNHTTSPASDSDSDDKAQQKVELQTLETKLSSNPSNYDAHVQYRKFLRKMGELDTIHNGDQPMAEDQKAELQTLKTKLSSNPSNYVAHVQENGRVKHNPQRRSAHGGGCAPKPYYISRFRFRFQRRSLAENGAPNPRDEALLQPFQLRRLCPVESRAPNPRDEALPNPSNYDAHVQYIKFPRKWESWTQSNGDHHGGGRAPKLYYISRPIQILTTKPRESELPNPETKLSSNPSNYNAHFIKFLRKMRELDTIHNGDQPMAEDVPQNCTTSPISDSDSDDEAQ